MRQMINAALLSVSLMAIVAGVLLAPVSEVSAVTLYGCRDSDPRPPKFEPCDGWCWQGANTCMLIPEWYETYISNPNGGPPMPYLVNVHYCDCRAIGSPPLPEPGRNPWL